MLLLYHRLCGLDERLLYHLHSTMLLLYQFTQFDACLVYLFTFHYASTLSVPIMITRQPRDKFTFHYASTLSL